MGTYRVETEDGVFDVEVDDSSSAEVKSDSSIGGDLLKDSPQLALSLAQLIPGPVGSAIDATSSALEHPFAFAFGGPSANKIQEGANLAGILKTAYNADKSSVGSFLNDLGKNEEVFPSTGITSAKTDTGKLAQLGINLTAPFLQKKFSNADPVAKKINNPEFGPKAPKTEEVSKAIDQISSKSDTLSNFYKKSLNYGSDVIDQSAMQKVSSIDPQIKIADESLAKTSYELARKFRDDFFPKYSQKISEDFGKAWDGVVGNIEIEGSDIQKAFSDFGRSSGLYNKATYSPETLLPIEKKILSYVNGVGERVSSESVNRMKLSDLSSGFEDILRSEYGKQWKTPILDKFRRSFVDLAGDSKYSEMKDVKARFKPLYQFREDMRPFFGKKKGEANLQPAVNLFKNWAGGELQTKNPSHHALIKKITQEFGDQSLDSISKISKDRADLLATRQSILSQADADKNLLSANLMAKVSNTVKDKNEQVGILDSLMKSVEERKSKDVINKSLDYVIDRFTPFSRERNLVRKFRS